MITRYSASLDGKQLHEIDASIIILDIVEAAPRMNVTVLNRINGGQMLTGRTRKSLTVSITFEVHEYDTVKRKAVFQKIASWAENGKYLSVSDRPGQRLRIVPDAAPVATSALKWTKAETVSFTAYASPYWEAAAPVLQEAAGTTGEIAFTPDFTADKSYMTFELVNNGASDLGSVSVTANDTFMHFTGLDIAPGETFSVTYDDDGHLLLPVARRTPDSSDELVVYGGRENAVSFVCDQPVTIRFSVRGRYE